MAITNKNCKDKSKDIKIELAIKLKFFLMVLIKRYYLGIHNLAYINKCLKIKLNKMID